MAKPALLLLATMVACAPIQRTETFVDTPVEPVVKTEAIVDSEVFEVNREVHGDVIGVRIRRSERCSTVTTPRSRRTLTVTRTAEAKFMSTAWVVAGTGLVMGAIIYFNAEGWSAMDHMEDPNSTSTPEQYRGTGAVMAAIGAFAGIIGIGNTVRARDSVEDGGLIDGTPDSIESSCRGELVTEEKVILHVDGHKFEGTTDREGEVDFALTDLTTDSIPHAGMRLYVTFRDEKEPIDVTNAESSEIQAALAANPNSRFSQEVEERQDEICRAAVNRAKQTSDVEIARDPDGVVAIWSAARTKCGTRWTDDDEAALVAVGLQAELVRCNLVLERIDAALEYTLDRYTADALEAEFANADMLCPANRVKAARKEYAKALEELEAAEAAIAEGQALLGALIDLEEAMINGEAEVAYRILKSQPKVKSIFSSDTENHAWDLLVRSVANVLDAYPSKSEAALAMCFTRNVFKIIVGNSELKKAVQRFVSDVGSSDPDRAAKVVKALKAGKCK